jgi:putative tryptophan/tyrosine transport system substrate-binding protein
MNRRKFLMLVGGAVACPFVARAQQSTMPVIGFLGSQSPAQWIPYVAGFRQGLAETGFIEGQNIAIEYRWAEAQYDRLPALAADLVRRRVAVIVASGGNVSALAAKGATAVVPTVFTAVADPVAGGLVASLNRPGGNVTGIAAFTIELDAKRLQLLSELVPTAGVIGVLADARRVEIEIQLRNLEEAARTIGRRVVVVRATNEGDYNVAFATFLGQRVGALLVAASPLFSSHIDRLVALTAHNAIPAIFQQREFALAGGLISYGPDLVDAYRQAGVYVGRILKGEKPSELPVVRPTKFDMVINLKTARALGLTVPATLLATANEVIE